MLLLLGAALTKLQEYGPMCIRLMEPPYEFAPLDKPIVALIALQLKHVDPLTCTETSLANVAPHMLLLEVLEAALLKLQEYAPTCITLIEPPYEFAP
jgi:hypothetical protein